MRPTSVTTNPPTRIESGRGRSRPAPTRIRVAVAIAGLALLVGCDSGSSPTRPSAASPELGAATIVGSAVSGDSAVVGAGAAASITVTVQGTALETTTDPRGGFRLEEVPTGDQQLVFETQGFSAALLISQIRNGERIELDVQVSPSQVQVRRMNRTTEVSEIDASALTLDVAPKDWNVNYGNSSGSVTTFLRGPGFELIDPASVVLVGDAGELASFDSTTQGNHVRSRFRKRLVLDLLDDPVAGTTHTVTVRFEGKDGSGPFELPFDVSILGPGDPSEEEEAEDEEPADEVDLSLQLQPKKWNTNFPNSNGTVSAKIIGSGWDRVDLGSEVVLIGDAGEVVSNDVRAQGNHVRARWPMADAWTVLEDPTSGSFHDVVVRFTVDGSEQELTATVEINGR